MDLRELETDLLRRMTPAKKLEVMKSLIRQAAGSGRTPHSLRTPPASGTTAGLRRSA